jgi:hypothetical protein
MVNTFPANQAADVRAQFAIVYTDQGCTELAPITTLAGTPISGSEIVVGDNALWPLFLCPSPYVYIHDTAGSVLQWFPVALGTEGTAQPAVTITGSRSTGAAMTSLIAALVSGGANIIDGTSA